MKRVNTSFRFCLVIFLSTCIAQVSIADAGKHRVAGWIERVALTDKGALFEAKVDTGADTSSVHAENIRHFSRNNKPWVEFTLRDMNDRPYTLQRPLERIARIKKKTVGYQERPVVILQLCVGDLQRGVEFNLSQRAHFRYPVLLGRNFLSGNYLVDSGAKHLLAPTCPGSQQY